MAAIAYPLSQPAGYFSRAGRAAGDVRRTNHLRLVANDLREAPRTRPEGAAQREIPTTVRARMATGQSVRIAVATPSALRFRLRRVLVVAATVAVIGGIWTGAGALAGTRSAPLSRIAGAKAVPGGYRYTVRPGDTVWSLATALDPTGDPRPIVDSLDAQLNGKVLQPGVVLRLP